MNNKKTKNYSIKLSKNDLIGFIMILVLFISVSVLPIILRELFDRENMNVFLNILNNAIFILMVLLLSIGFLMYYNLIFLIEVEKRKSIKNNIYIHLIATFNHIKKNIFVLVAFFVLVLSFGLPIQNFFHRNYVYYELIAIYDGDEGNYSTEFLNESVFGSIENKEELINSLYNKELNYEGDLDHKTRYYTFKETYLFKEGNLKYFFYFVFEELIFYFTYVFIPVLFLSSIFKEKSYTPNYL